MKKSIMLVMLVLSMVIVPVVASASGSWEDGWVQVSEQLGFSVLAVRCHDQCEVSMLEVSNPPTSEFPHWEKSLGNLHVSMIRAASVHLNPTSDVAMVFVEHPNCGVFYLNANDPETIQKYLFEGSSGVAALRFAGFERGVLAVARSAEEKGKYYLKKINLHTREVLTVELPMDVSSEVEFHFGKEEKKETTSMWDWNDVLAIISKNGSVSIYRIGDESIEEIGICKIPKNSRDFIEGVEVDKEGRGYITTGKYKERMYNFNIE